MPIEFRCTQCDRLLRTPDGTEGKSAKCPQCGTLVAIPSASPVQQAPPPQSPPPQSPPPYSPPPHTPPPAEQASASGSAFAPPPELRETTAYGDSANPYQSPTASQMHAHEHVHLKTGFNPTAIDLGETLSRTWQIYKMNMGMLILGGLVYIFCNFFAGGIIGLVFSAILSNAQGIEAAIVSIMENVLTQAVSTFFWIGMIRYTLQIARGGPAEFGLLFSGGPWFLFGVAIQIITTLIMVVGFIFLIVPGIILALMFSQVMYVLVDQDSDIMGSIRLSAQATKGNKMTILALYLLTFAIGIVVTVLTCGIGFFLVVPFGMMLLTVIYLGVTGQPTVLDALSESSMERSFQAPGAEPAF